MFKTWISRRSSSRFSSVGRVVPGTRRDRQVRHPVNSLDQVTPGNEEGSSR